MCTLILGRDVLGEGTVILAANRDEDPARPSDPPLVLRSSPRVVGGRDRVAGGTWLAVRERRAAVALLNRRPPEGVTLPAAGGAPRSRGLLTIEVASAEGASLAEAAAERMRALAARDRYAAFTLLFASPERCWWWRGVPGEDAPLREIGAGWHVVTHEDLDDQREPRTAWLMRDLAAFAPRDVDEAAAGLLSRLRLHAGDRNRSPAVCIHQGHMSTVSSSLVWLAGGKARYLHTEGWPCENAPKDYSSLTTDESSARENA